MSEEVAFLPQAAAVDLANFVRAPFVVAVAADEEVVLLAAGIVVVVALVVALVVVALAVVALAVVALAALVAAAKLVRCPSASGQPETLPQKLGWQHFVDLVLDLCHSF